VRLTEIKILRDLTIITYPTNLIPQQTNISKFTIKDRQLSKTYILIPRIQNLITPENKIIKSANDITDEIWIIVINIIKSVVKIEFRFTIIMTEIQNTLLNEITILQKQFDKFIKKKI
jgi:hypothetical protein